MDTLEQKRAIILLSGGLDSTTCLYLAKSKGFSCYGLTFDYGQRHRHELRAAQQIAQSAKVKKHLILNCDLGAIGGSALTDNLAVPKGRTLEQMTAEIPSTYVPARNTIFLSYALAWAETLNCFDIFVGVNVLDYSGYPDCRPEFVEAFERMANLATRATTLGEAKVRIHAPLMQLNKAEIIRLGSTLKVDYGATHSCYDPTEEGQACGQCDACLLRTRGFRDAGLTDPTIYAYSTVQARD